LKLHDRLSLMIHTCEKFSDLWDSHIRLLELNWKDRDVETYLVTDEGSNRSYDHIQIIATGKGCELPQRAACALSSITTEYILVTLDDYFPIYPIDSRKIERLLDIMDKEKIDYMRLFPIPNSKRKFGDYQDLYEIALEEEYDVNLYQGIWRKSFMNHTIDRPLNAWKYEVSLTNIAKKSGAKCVLSKGNEFRILDVVRKGKLLTKANRYLRRYDLYHGDRDVIKRTVELKLLIVGTSKRIIPKPLRKHAKSIMRKFGYHFYSDETI